MNYSWCPIGDVVAVIPARAGSKRLPKKNMKPLLGMPLVGYAIKAALSSKCITDVIVSSDDSSLIEYAESLGARSPFFRPVELASDTATTADVVKHLIENATRIPKTIIVLQPTSPLRTESHIDEAYNDFIDKNALNIVGLCEVDHPVEWCGVLGEGGSMNAFINEKYIKRRCQDLAIRYRINGAIYIVDTKAFMKQNTLILNDKYSYGYLMHKLDSIDIDDEVDFGLAEYVLSTK